MIRGMKLLKDRLKYARKLARKTQKEVADFVGVSQPAYHQLESGQTVSSTCIASIAVFLGVDPYWLETGKGEMNSINIDLLVAQLKNLDQQKQFSILSRILAVVDPPPPDKS